MIDLGHVSAPDVPTWPSERRLSRAWIGFVLAVGVMLAVGGTSLPADPMPLVMSLPIGTDAHVTVHGNQVFVLDTVGINGRLRAYGLPGGDRHWTASVTGRTENADMFMSRTGLVVLAQDRNSGGVVVQGFDQISGAARWSLAAYGVTPIGPDLLLSVPTTGVEQVGSGNTVERVDSETGRVKWTMAVPYVCETTVSNVGDVLGTGLVEMCANQGLLYVHDLGTGRTRAKLDLNAVPRVDHLPFVSQGFLVVDGVVIVAMWANRNVVVTAYRTEDLTPLWSVEQDASAQLFDCAPQVCVQSPSGIATLDPLTGRPVPIPPVVAQALALHPKAGVLEFVVVPVGARSTLDPDRADVMVSQALPEGRLMALPGYLPASGTITWITLQEGRVFRPVAPLHGVGAGCRFESAYVVCVTALERITLWHLMIR